MESRRFYPDYIIASDRLHLDSSKRLGPVANPVIIQCQTTEPAGAEVTDNPDVQAPTLAGFLPVSTAFFPTRVTNTADRSASRVIDHGSLIWRR